MIIKNRPTDSWRSFFRNPPTIESSSASITTGGKAGRLIEGAAAGLPVPALVVVSDGAVVPTAAQLRAAGVLTETVAVRSVFSAEDQAESSLAGWFRTELRVPIDQVAAAVERVRASAEDRTSDLLAAGIDPGRLRRDVMIMTMVQARQSGVAFTEPGTYDDMVNATSGTAERLVGGDEPGAATTLARLESEPEGWRQRLQHLLRSVREVFGDQPWDIEWADDDSTCWLVQIRPITTPIRRNEAFTIANHAEILPPLPSHLMTSVIEGAGRELFGWYRRFDDSLPDNRLFLEVIAGRPFINLTLLEDLLRHLGLPTRLVADSIGGPPDNDRPADIRRIAVKSPVLVRMGLAQIAAVVRAGRIQRKLAAMGEPQAQSFTEALHQLQRAYVGLVTGMFPLSSAIGPPMAVLRRAGTLAHHAGRHRTITTELAEALDDVQAGTVSIDRFMTQFGHRAVYESDIARPRFSDDPGLLGQPGGGRATIERPATATFENIEKVTVRQRLLRAATRPVWAAARQPVTAREALRHQAMAGFADIRLSLVDLADQAVKRGQLRQVDDLWLLTTDEACALDKGWTPAPAFWTDRLDERDRLAELDPPPVVKRFDDPASWRQDAPTGDRLSGLPLTDGVVGGKAWVLREPSVDLPEGFDPASTVLVARSVDAGWIPTFTQVAAVVVETGGDLSHGSILLRERGVPAITNVSGATRFFSTGQPVEVRVGAGVIEKR